MTSTSLTPFHGYMREDCVSPTPSMDSSLSESDSSHADGDSTVNLDYLSRLFTDHPVSEGLPPAPDSTGTDSDCSLGHCSHTTPGDGKGTSRKPCKYVPHREKPVHVVEKRNARERRRVEAVNSAFVRLRRTVPHENRRKRISKVKTLRIAIDYIHYLQDLIAEYDNNQIQEAVHAAATTGGGPGLYPGCQGHTAGGWGPITHHNHHPLQQPQHPCDHRQPAAYLPRLPSHQLPPTANPHLRHDLPPSHPTQHLLYQQQQENSLQSDVLRYVGMGSHGGQPW